ncbi:MAG: TraR/DksA C4-type zinc finger protein [Bacteroidia bacterium]|jgi:RNA polymerase-binding transcription factor DksA|nr:TraR/DksA C4-type zinc finger protein [Bacteroidia bacterium]
MEDKVKVRYSDLELEEFRQLIEEKLVEANAAYNQLKESLDTSNDNTSHASTWDVEDSSDINEKEYLIAMMSRQIKYINNLRQALNRINNKTYGICRQTGNLIDKQRLRAVPHATLSMEAKLSR